LKNDEFYKQVDDESQITMLASVAASITVRLAGKQAYEKKKIGLVTPDIIDVLPDVLSCYYPDESCNPECEVDCK
jgi:hypothetical protein